MKSNALLKLVLCILSGCCLMILSEASFAKLYQIDLIVFSHITAAGVNQEQWPLISLPASKFEDAISLNNTRQDGYYQALPSENFLLKREAYALNSTWGYNVIFHATWQQPVTSDRANPIRINGQNAKNLVSVDGLMRLNVNHYFNVHFNLYFAVPRNLLSRLDAGNHIPSGSDPVYFHFSETRRMKSHELNYIDNPLFGVLIKIIPVNSKK